ncbi:ABC transporter ATP-binding protein, partial [bacterium AH-315-P15]|nr:ABC transporter ATP-binding protein [bacterium AH-315-P15]
RITLAAYPELTAKLLAGRTLLHRRIEERGLSHLVESFDPDRYNKNATLAENLLFGLPRGPLLADGALAQQPYFTEVLGKAGIADRVAGIGFEIACTMVELFADLPPDHPFFDQFSFISADELPDYQALVNRYGSRVTYHSLAGDDRVKIIALSLRYVEARHRLSLIDADFEAQFVLARKIFARGLPNDVKGAVEPYDPDAYNGATSIQDNLLFGRIAYGQAGAIERVGEVMTEVLEELGLHEAVYGAGLDFNVGPGGKRLTASQRQRLGLARAILKRPDILVIDAALAVLDTPTQELILENVLKSSGSRAVIWVLARPYQAKFFDRILVIDEGRVIEEGTAPDLEARGGRFTALAAGPRG